MNGRVVADSVSVNIYNITKNIGTINNSKGEFKIGAELNDTIIFTSLQHKNYSMIITKEEIETPYVEVFLKRKVEFLNEVFVSKSGFSGNLEQDLLHIPIDTYIDGGIFGGKPVIPLTQTQRKLRSVSVGAVTKIVNTINGKIKQAKRDVELENSLILSKVLQARLTEKFYTEDLGISIENIQGFMNYCSDDNRFKSFKDVNRTLELVEFLEIKSKEYLKLIKR